MGGSWRCENSIGGASGTPAFCGTANLLDRFLLLRPDYSLGAGGGYLLAADRVQSVQRMAWEFSLPRMQGELVLELNLWFGWVWITVGLVSGAVIGRGDRFVFL